MVTSGASVNCDATYALKNITLIFLHVHQGCVHWCSLCVYSYKLHTPGVCALVQLMCVLLQALHTPGVCALVQLMCVFLQATYTRGVCTGAAYVCTLTSYIHQGCVHWCSLCVYSYKLHTPNSLHTSKQL